MNSHNIINESLAPTLVPVMVVVLINRKEKPTLGKDIFWNVGRTIIQLIVIGYVLECIFSMDDASLTLLMMLSICFSAARGA